jgi:hypothetical protein
VARLRRGGRLIVGTKEGLGGTREELVRTKEDTCGKNGNDSGFGEKSGFA